MAYSVPCAETPGACKEMETIMAEKTCAACDCELDANAIKVKVGGKTVEVCCESAREQLQRGRTRRRRREAHGRED